MRIRIIDVPPGEAPAEIRRAWLGIVLPVAQGHEGPRTLPGVGVLTGPRGMFSLLLRLFLGRVDKVNGYPVEARLAFEALELHAPQAAAWWRANTPHLYENRRYLVFHAPACEPVVDSDPR